VEEARRTGLPVLDAHVVPRDGSQWPNSKSAVAFAGIGDPGKFFRTLEGLGCRIVHHAAFPDHHAFTAQDADTLLRLAASHGAQLVTTEKDMARLNGGGSIERLRKASHALPVRLRFKDQGKVRRLLARVMKTR
jgi:tetraacyldisaccharide 4'-kinase